MRARPWWAYSTVHKLSFHQLVRSSRHRQLISRPSNKYILGAVPVPSLRRNKILYIHKIILSPLSVPDIVLFHSQSSYCRHTMIYLVYVSDRISILRLADLAPRRPLKLSIDRDWDTITRVVFPRLSVTQYHLPTFASLKLAIGQLHYAQGYSPKTHVFVKTTVNLVKCLYSTGISVVDPPHFRPQIHTFADMSWASYESSLMW